MANSNINQIRAMDPETWEVQHVVDWLGEIGFGQYKQHFIREDISGAALVELEDDDLIAIGVQSLGERKRLQKKLNALSRRAKGAWDDQSVGSASSNGSQASSVQSHNSSSAFSSTWSQTSATGSSEFLAKCFYEGDIAMLRFARDITLAEFKSMIEKEFKLRNVSLRYKDGDDDLIQLRKDDDITTALMVTQQLRVYVEGESAKKKTKRASRSKDNQVSSAEKSLLEGFVDAVVIIDKRGVIVFFNSAAEALWGYKRSEVIGSNVRKLMPRSIAKRHNRYLRRYHRTGEKKIIGKGRKVAALHKSGSKFHVWLSVTETKEGSRKHIFTGIAQKITSASERQKKTEAALNTSPVGSSSDATTKNALNTNMDYSLFNALLDGALVINTKGVIQYANDAIEGMLGFKPIEVLGRNVSFLMPSVYSESSQCLLSAYLDDAKDQNKLHKHDSDVIAHDRQGSILPVNVQFNKVGRDKELVSVIIRPVDTKLDRREKSILEEQREVVDSLLVPAIIIDEKCTMHQCNESAQKLLGYNLMEVLGRNVKMLLRSQVREEHDEHISHYIKTGDSKGILGVGREVIMLKKNGEFLRVQLAVTVRKDKEKHIFTGIIQPVRIGDVQK